MIVTDDSEFSETIQLELMPLGIELTFAKNSEHALALLTQDTPPDLLIIDHTAAIDEEGVSLCQRLRANATLATIYVLRLVDAPQRRGVRDADEILTKPYSAPNLRALVRTGLRAQAHRRVLARRERRRAMEWLGSVVAHELNNPLAVAMSSMECMGQIIDDAVTTGKIGSEDLCDLQELAGATKAVLERIHASSKRLTASGGHLETSSPSRASWEQISCRIKESLPDALNSRCQFSPEKQCASHATFDIQMLADASVRIIEAASPLCSGEIRVLMHLDGCRAAVLIELENPPSIDPETILEPRLATSGREPPQYQPGLSAVEAVFARHGGQIFARPAGTLWRFGLTLPTKEPSATYENDPILATG